MTKNDIAKAINHKANIVRVISSNYKLDFEEGTIYDNQEKAESWQDDSCTRDFDIETQRKYVYALYCNDVPCHKVDYTNFEETETLGATGCEHEGEVLVAANAIMEITGEPFDEDFEQLGYYVVNLDFLGFKEVK